MDHIHALPSGTLLEEYRLHSVLGAGGFGITYRAEDTHLNKVVAIKEYLPSEFATRTETRTVVPHSGTQAQDYHWGLTRFLDEARALARFDHPHLNKVHRYFETNGTAYLVLEYIEGETLGDLLDRRGTLPEVELRRLLAEVLGGLAVVHEAGYVHRDVKPGNLMLRSADSSVVLLDFGAARQAVGQRSRSVTSILTPGYAPIEQYGMRAEDVGPWSDIYALGMVAYRCISGLRDGQLPDAVTRSGDQRKGGGDWASAVAVGSGRYADGLLRAIDWAVAVNEEDRPQGVAQWRAALSGEADGTAYIQGKGRSTAKPAASPSLAPTSQDSRAGLSSMLTVLLAGVALLALVGGGVYWFMQNQPRPDTAEADLAVEPAPAVTDQSADQPAGEGQPTEPDSPVQISVVDTATPEPAASDGAAVETGLGLTRAERRRIQQGLTAAGFQPGSADGLFGEGTRSALRDWQASRGETVTGHLDAASAKTLLDLGSEFELWESVKGSESPADFEGYLSRYPDGTHAAEARSRRQALITADDAAYARAQSAGTVAAYGEYLQSYPAGRHADEARRLQEARAADLRPGQSFSDELGSGGQGPEMVVLPAGRFRMGCVSGRDCEDNEMPVHEVSIAEPFAMSKYEVTRGEFGRFVAQAGYRTTAERGRGCYVWDGSTVTEKSSARWNNPGFNQSDTHPVVCVSWDDAVAYAEWLSSETGKPYRLPGEAEWEYAARSGSRTKYHFGDAESQLCRYANHADRSTNFSWRNESCSDGVSERTAEVGSYQPNSFGLHDMHGNVWEWVQDCWNDSYVGAPSDGSAWKRGDCGKRVLRGGSWSNAPRLLRSAFRGWFSTDSRDSIYGFRVARTLAVETVTPEAPASDAAAVEAALGLDRAERRRVQQGLTAAGFNPGLSDGLFGEGTRSALRDWQASRDEAATGYLNAESAKTLLALGSELGPGRLFKDELASGGKGPEMVVLPAGRFRMGCLSGRDCFDWEKPVHEVRIAQPFALSKYEVTRGEFGRFVTQAGYRTTAERSGGCHVWDGSKWTEKSSARWNNPGFNQSDTHPVVCVSWDDAVAYVEWLSSETGVRYRLPGEAEWEYAARSGSATKYHFGDDESQLCRYANHADRSTNFSWRNESCSDGVGERTAEVGSYRPNDFGLYDMHGNVREWVQDCWNDSYVGAPSDGSTWTSGNCADRVLRGGTWSLNPRFLRAAYRYGLTSDLRSGSFGFRVARTLTP